MPSLSDVIAERNKKQAQISGNVRSYLKQEVKTVVSNHQNFGASRRGDIVRSPPKAEPVDPMQALRQLNVKMQQSARHTATPSVYLNSDIKKSHDVTSVTREDDSDQSKVVHKNRPPLQIPSSRVSTIGTSTISTRISSNKSTDNIFQARNNTLSSKIGSFGTSNHNSAKNVSTSSSLTSSGNCSDPSITSSSKSQVNSTLITGNDNQGPISSSTPTLHSSIRTESATSFGIRKASIKSSSFKSVADTSKKIDHLQSVFSFSDASTTKSKALGGTTLRSLTFNHDSDDENKDDGTSNPAKTQTIVTSSARRVDVQNISNESDIAPGNSCQREIPNITITTQRKDNAENLTKLDNCTATSKEIVPDSIIRQNKSLDESATETTSRLLISNYPEIRNIKNKLMKPAPRDTSNNITTSISHIVQNKHESRKNSDNMESEEEVELELDHNDDDVDNLQNTKTIKQKVDKFENFVRLNMKKKKFSYKNSRKIEKSKFYVRKFQMKYGETSSGTFRGAPNYSKQADSDVEDTTNQYESLHKYSLTNNGNFGFVKFGFDSLQVVVDKLQVFLQDKSAINLPNQQLINTLASLLGRIDKQKSNCDINNLAYIPRCHGHFMPCKVLTVKKTGPNKGRKFYSCCFPFDQKCDFFMWQENNPQLINDIIYVTESMGANQHDLVDVRNVDAVRLFKTTSKNERILSTLSDFEKDLNDMTVNEIKDELMFLKVRTENLIDVIDRNLEMIERQTSLFTYYNNMSFESAAKGFRANCNRYLTGTKKQLILKALVFGETLLELSSILMKDAHDMLSTNVTFKGYVKEFDSNGVSNSSHNQAYPMLTEESMEESRMNGESREVSLKNSKNISKSIDIAGSLIGPQFISNANPNNDINSPGNDDGNDCIALSESEESDVEDSGTDLDIGEDDVEEAVVANNALVNSNSHTSRQISILPFNFISFHCFENINIGADVGNALYHNLVDAMSMTKSRNVAKIKLNDLLRVIFTHNRFRKFQKKAIIDLVSGKNRMLLLRTGGGKSLVYTMTSLLLGGLTIIVMPLSALMSDQRRNMPLEIKYQSMIVNSGNMFGGSASNGAQSYTMNSVNLTVKESIELIHKILTGSIKVLFVSPETVTSESFQELMKFVQEMFQNYQRWFCSNLTTDSSSAPIIPSMVSQLVIDESHCVSQWSHNFRPDYKRIVNYVGKNADENNFIRPQVTLAMTATATQEVIKDILDAINIDAKSLGENMNDNVETNKTDLQEGDNELEDAEPEDGRKRKGRRGGSKKSKRFNTGISSDNESADELNDADDKETIGYNKNISLFAYSISNNSAIANTHSAYDNSGNANFSAVTELLRQLSVKYQTFGNQKSTKSKSKRIDFDVKTFPQTIVYAWRRVDCDLLSKHLLQNLVTNCSLDGSDDEHENGGKKSTRSIQPIVSYHSGLPAEKRRALLQAIHAGKVRVVVCTISFGLGLNIASIRHVIHCNCDASVEQYVQEIGRCGRAEKAFYVNSKSSEDTDENNESSNDVVSYLNENSMNDDTNNSFCYLLLNDNDCLKRYSKHFTQYLHHLQILSFVYHLLGDEQQDSSRTLLNGLCLRHLDIASISTLCDLQIVYIESILLILELKPFVFLRLLQKTFQNLRVKIRNSTIDPNNKEKYRLAAIENSRSAFESNRQCYFDLVLYYISEINEEVTNTSTTASNKYNNYNYASLILDIEISELMRRTRLSYKLLIVVLYEMQNAGIVEYSLSRVLFTISLDLNRIRSFLNIPQTLGDNDSLSLEQIEPQKDTVGFHTIVFQLTSMIYDFLSRLNISNSMKILEAYKIGRFIESFAKTYYDKADPLTIPELLNVDESYNYTSQVNIRTALINCLKNSNMDTIATSVLGDDSDGNLKLPICKFPEHTSIKPSKENQQHWKQFRYDVSIVAKSDVISNYIKQFTAFYSMSLSNVTEPAIMGDFYDFILHSKSIIIAKVLLGTKFTESIGSGGRSGNYDGDASMDPQSSFHCYGSYNHFEFQSLYQAVESILKAENLY